MGKVKNSYEKVAELDSIPLAELLAIGVPEVRFYRTARGLQALCPFHDDATVGSFLFDPNTGIWKCFACGEGGRGVISFLMRVRGWDFLQAVDHLYEHRNDIAPGFSTSVPSALARQGHKPKASLAKTAERPLSHKERFLKHGKLAEEDLDAIYRAFAASSPLSAAERGHLQAKRGLAYGATKDFFRMPSPKDDLFWVEFRERLREHDEWDGQDRLYYSLIGVPGFYWDEENGVPSFVSYEGATGMLLHSPAGLVNGIDMRVPEGGDKATRYIGFSSGGICARHPETCTLGAKLDVLVDVVPCFYPKSSARYRGTAITEGKFKALHLAYRGYTVLNVRGASNWKRVFDLLPTLADGRPVTIAFDADSRVNPAVAKASADLGQALMGAGYTVQYLTWSIKDGKGFDDLCNNGLYCKARAVPGPEFLETTLEPFLARAQRKKPRGAGLGA